MKDEQLILLFDEMRQEMRQEIGGVRQEIAAVRQEVAVLRDETRQEFAAVRQEVAAVRQENAAAQAETRHLFGATADGLRHHIELVIEGVTTVNEKLARETADIRDEMRRGFAETQAMIKYSHTDLDRRLRVLEGG